MTARKFHFQRLERLGLAAMVILAITAWGCQMPNHMLRARAWEALQERDYTTARNQLRIALVQDPADWQARVLMARVCLAQGQALEAQLHLEHALMQRPDHPETSAILDLMAEALYQQGEEAKLAAFLERTATERKNVEDYLRQARYLARISDSDGVNRAFLRAQKMAAPDDIRPYLAAAEYYQEIGETNRALSHLRQAYQIAPTNPKVLQMMEALGAARP